jgi:hypothetical protein
LRRLKIVAVVFLGLVAVGVVLLATRWPFTRAGLTKALHEQSSGTVSVGRLHKTWFPHPGCVAENVVIRQPGAPQPLITIPKLTVVGEYTGLLTHPKRLRSIRTEGMRIVVPAHKTGGGSGSSKGGDTAVDELTAVNTALEFAAETPGQPPYRIDIHNAVLSGIAPSRPLVFRAALHIPQPPGEVRSEGKFGPWNSQDPYRTPVAGSYRFEHADLGVFPGIGGFVNSEGKFQGTIERIAVRGGTDLPDFEVKSAGHPVHLKTQFDAEVNGRNGDTMLHPVNARFQSTTVLAQGGVADHEHVKGKTVALDMSVPQGRIQDLLYLFVHAKPPGMTGPITLRAHVVLPPEDRRFLEKLEMRAEFGIGGARFSSASTQHSLDDLSERARGGKDDSDPERVLSNLKGSVVLRNGVARFTNVSFAVPGARALLGGTYNLLNERIDLHGTVHMDVNLSQSTGGVKSFFLKFLDPFFKRKHAPGSIVPVKITGTYDHPSVGLDLTGRKKAD